MKVKCLRCNNEWDYTGKRNWAQCPKCMYMMKLIDAPEIPRQKHSEPQKGKIDVKVLFEEYKKRIEKNPLTEEDLDKIADKDNT